MRAAILESPNSAMRIVDDLSFRPITGREVRVKIAHCGVCHSDLHVIDGQLPSMMPTVLGHEAAGTVVEVGSGVTEVSEGDKVIMTLKPSCGRCYFCVRGEHSLCAAYSVTAPGDPALRQGDTPIFSGVGMSAFADEVVVPIDATVKVDDDTPFDIACVIGCAVQTGVGAVLNTAQVEAGATVLVQGLGGVGISIIQGARIAGASQIIAVDPVEERRNLSGHFGATSTLDPTATDVAGAAFELTGGIGVDYCFDAVGMSSLIETGINANRPGGTTVCVGVPRIDDVINTSALFFALGEKKLLGCFLGSSDPRQEFPRMLDLWKHGKLDLEAMVTSRRPLDEINEAFDDMKAGKGIRTVLDM